MEAVGGGCWWWLSLEAVGGGVGVHLGPVGGTSGPIGRELVESWRRVRPDRWSVGGVPGPISGPSVQCRCSVGPNSFFLSGLTCSPWSGPTTQVFRRVLFCLYLLHITFAGK